MYKKDIRPRGDRGEHGRYTADIRHNARSSPHAPPGISSEQCVPERSKREAERSGGHRNIILPAEFIEVSIALLRVFSARSDVTSERATMQCTAQRNTRP